MEIFAEALKILAADVLLFGAFSVVGLLAALWLVCGNKPLKKWLATSVPFYWSILSPAFRAFFFAFFVVLVYIIGASFRAAADEWISDKPAKHAYLKNFWLNTDYAYPKKDDYTGKNELEKFEAMELRKTIQEFFAKDARKHTDKALKLHALAELIQHAEEATPQTVNSPLACRLKAYSAKAMRDIEPQKTCTMQDVIGNKSYEAIEEASRIYHWIKQMQIAADYSLSNRYDSETLRANLVIDFMRLTAFLSFMVAIAAVLGIFRKIIAYIFRIKSKIWLPTLKLPWIIVIFVSALISYMSAAAAWQALEIELNKITFRKYFAGGHAEKKGEESNRALADLNTDLRDLGLLINTSKPNTEK